MRVVAGKYGGRRLANISGNDIRPTSDKIRGAIFNTLGSMNVLDGAIVLDAFCGTGALGIEALSRGADHCTFTDKNINARTVTRENIENLNISESTQILLADITKPKPMAPPSSLFSLVFIDPPYNQELGPKALDALHTAGFLADGAVIVLETEKRDSGILPACYLLLKEKIYKDTKIRYLRYTRTPA